MSGRICKTLQDVKRIRRQIPAESGSSTLMVRDEVQIFTRRASKLAREETGGVMSILYFRQFGLLTAADVLGIDTPCVKPTSRRRVDGARDIANQENPLFFAFRIRDRGCRKKRSGVRMEGLAV
jgi:hypothetical protein